VRRRRLHLRFGGGGGGVEGLVPAPRIVSGLTTRPGCATVGSGGGVVGFMPCPSISMREFLSFICAPILVVRRRQYPRNWRRKRRVHRPPLIYRRHFRQVYTIWRPLEEGLGLGPMKKTGAASLSVGVHLGIQVKSNCLGNVKRFAARHRCGRSSSSFRNNAMHYTPNRDSGRLRKSTRLPPI
jgi:hypothetical protein